MEPIFCCPLVVISLCLVFRRLDPTSLTANLELKRRRRYSNQSNTENGKNDIVEDEFHYWMKSHGPSVIPLQYAEVVTDEVASEMGSKGIKRSVYWMGSACHAWQLISQLFRTWVRRGRWWDNYISKKNLNAIVEWKRLTWMFV